MTQVKVGSKELGYAGTLDFLFKNYDGTYSITDLKTGAAFKKQWTDAMLRGGFGIREDMGINAITSAKLQIMMYAVLLKAENPNMKFKDLYITHILNKSALKTNSELRNKTVQVNEYLPLIKNFVKDEMFKDNPEGYKNLLEKSPNIFNTEHYAVGYQKSTDSISRKHKDKGLDQQTQYNLVKLKELVMYGEIPNSKIEARKAREEEIKNLITWFIEKGIPTATKGKNGELIIGGTKLEELNDDISFLSLYLGSNNDINSPFIQLFAKMQAARQDKIKAKLYRMNARYKQLEDPIIRDLIARTGKKGIGRTSLSASQQNAAYSWMFKKELDSAGEQTNERFNITAEDWMEAYNNPEFKHAFEAPGKLKKHYRLYAEFVTNTFQSYMFADKVENKGEVPLFLRTAYLDAGTKNPVTNLDLMNSARRDQDGTPMNIVDTPEMRGFMPKVPRLMSELGTFATSSKYRKLWFYRTFTTYLEDEFYEVKNLHEKIPIKGMGSAYTNAGGNYSHNVQNIFKTYTKWMEYKSEMDDIYALGKGIELWLGMTDKSKDERDGSYENTKKWFGMVLETQIRKRHQGHNVDNWTGRKIWALAKKDAKGNTRNYSIPFYKILEGLRSMTSANSMWLKPINGTANGIFTYLYTIKEAVKGSIAKRTLWGASGDSTSFTISDIKNATAAY